MRSQEETSAELKAIRKRFEMERLIQQTNDYKPPVPAKNWQDPTPFKWPSPIPKKYFLYIMRNNRNAYFKIGYSSNPKFREKTLQAEDPDITLVHSWECCKSIETKVHRKFKDNRLRGEWFKLTDKEMLNVLAFINEQLYD